MVGAVKLIVNQLSWVLNHIILMNLYLILTLLLSLLSTWVLLIIIFITIIGVILHFLLIIRLK